MCPTQNPINIYHRLMERTKEGCRPSAKVTLAMVGSQGVACGVEGSVGTWRVSSEFSWCTTHPYLQLYHLSQDQNLASQFSLFSWAFSTTPGLLVHVQKIKLKSLWDSHSNNMTRERLVHCHDFSLFCSSSPPTHAPALPQPPLPSQRSRHSSAMTAITKPPGDALQPCAQTSLWVQNPFILQSIFHGPFSYLA